MDQGNVHDLIKHEFLYAVNIRLYRDFNIIVKKMRT